MTEQDQPKHDETGFWSIVDKFDELAEKGAGPLRRSAAANRLFYSASALADHSLAWFITAAAMGLNPRSGHKAKVLAAALIADSGMVNIVVKTAFNRDRPAFQGKRPLPLRQPLTSSFPSGHASAAFMWATIMSESEWIDPMYLAIASIVSYSRVHVQIHHASDVVGGAILGTAVGKVTKMIFLRSQHGS